MARKGREEEDGKTKVLARKEKGKEGVCAPPVSCGQLGLNVWERLRSKSGLKGERPVAFTERGRGRGRGGRVGGETCTGRVEGSYRETHNLYVAVVTDKTKVQVFLKWQHHRSRKHSKHSLIPVSKNIF